MSRNWTKPQLDAIGAPPEGVLVSAAAGSGKTAVLIERVLRRVMSKEAPADIDRFLMVTFTKAAASEMREKMARALEREFAENPGSLHLQNQLTLIHSAPISTVDSFCLSLLREYFYLLDLSPDFRIADETENHLLEQEAMEETLDQLYDAGDEAFLQLVDNFGTQRSDTRLSAILIKLYETACAHPEPSKWLESQKRLYKIEPDTKLPDTVWGRELFAHTENALRFELSRTGQALALCMSDSRLLRSYGAALKDDGEFLNEVQKAVSDRDYDGARELLQSHSFAKLGPLKNFEDTTLKERVQGLRKAVKGSVEKLSMLFEGTAEQCLEDIRRVGALYGALADAVTIFERRLWEKKQRRGIIYFYDAEQLAFKLLVKQYDYETGELVPTDVALEVGKRFDEVLMDEFQDTHELQDAIFRALTKAKNNLFMVGDAKQSIYRFRLAMPEIFIAKKKKAVPCDEKRGSDGQSINVELAHNFRSRRQIVDAVNFFFGCTMSRDFGEIDYSGGERLINGAVYPTENEGCYGVECIVLDIDSEDQASGQDEVTGDESDMEIVEELSKTEMEAAAVAQRVKRILDEGLEVTDSETGELRAAQPRDVVILLRSPKGRADIYEQALMAAGVPCFAQDSAPYLSTQEVSMVLSLLQTIDNPLQDIPLVSALRSFVFAFTPDKLVKIRLCKKNAPFFEAVVAASENGDEDCRAFLDWLTRYRELSTRTPVDELIWQLYDETGLPAMVASLPNGELRRQNLMLLYNHARRFEETSFKGLFHFVHFINRLMENSTDFTGAKAGGENQNVVRIMSIHKSKGLEFPVCIVAGLGSPFNMMDLNEPVLLHHTMGMGCKLRSHGGLVEYSSFCRDVLALDIKRSTLSEELRILYVAMTRAREKLILSMTSPKIENTLFRLSDCLDDKGRAFPHALSMVHSPSQWILACLLRHPSGLPLREIAGIDSERIIDDESMIEVTVLRGAEAVEQYEVQTRPEPSAKAQYPPELLEEIRYRLEFEYPFKELTQIPAKVSVTELKGRRFLDEEAVPLYQNQSSLPELRFEQSTQAVTAVQAGTAAHLLLRFTDIEEFSGAPDPLMYLKDLSDRLVRLGHLTPEEAGAVDTAGVLSFLKSPLAGRLRRSYRAEKERRFTVEVPAGVLLPRLAGSPAGDEPIILQGVIDCWFEEEDGLVVVDYKTDRVKNGEQLVGRYKNQLDWYAYALRAMTGKSVKEKWIYSLGLRRAVLI